MIYVHPDYALQFDGLTTVNDFLNIDAVTVRDFKHRKTGRFERDGRGFYIKKHFACGLPTIADELLHLRKPHIGAGHEWHVIKELRTLGIDTLKAVAFGHDELRLDRRRSFLITEELKPVRSLAKVAAEWNAAPPPAAFRKAIIAKLAHIAKTLHDSGINHRDFYLCHFLLNTNTAARVWDTKPTLYLVDLHRAQQRSHVPFRWRVKDIGALYFSALDISLTRSDIARFMCMYAGKPLRQTLHEDGRFWKAVWHRAVRMYRRDFGRTPGRIFRNAGGAT